MIKPLFLLFLLLQFNLDSTAQVKLYLAANGNDKNPGTLQKPLKTLQSAVFKVLSQRGKDAVIEIRGGIYNLEETIEITSASYLLHSLVIRAYQNEKVIVTGSRKINPQWTPY